MPMPKASASSIVLRHNVFPGADAAGATARAGRQLMCGASQLWRVFHVTCTSRNVTRSNLLGFCR